MHVRTEMEMRRTTIVTLAAHELQTIQVALAHLAGSELHRPEHIACAKAMYEGLIKVGSNE